MLDGLKIVVAELCSSKKFTVMAAGGLASVLTALAGKAGWSWLDQSTADMISWKILGAAAVYCGGQAIADHGKEAALIESGTHPMTGPDSK